MGRARRGLGKRITLVALGCAGCNALLGLEDGTLVEERCEPRSAIACYAGPPATEGIGACRAGLQTCSARGDGRGACEGEVLPSIERCGNAIDDDCDGATDEGCACAPGAIEACPYPGPREVLGVGACRAGSRACGPDGRWGTCEGEVLPRDEDCAPTDDVECQRHAGCWEVRDRDLLGADGRQEALAIAGAPGGGAFVAGRFSGRLGIGPERGAGDLRDNLFVARLSSSSEVAWTRPLLRSGEAELWAIAAPPPGGSSGHGGSSAEPACRAGDGAAVVVVGELLHGELATSCGHLDPGMGKGFVLGLSADGDLAWVQSVPGSPRDVVITGAGEVVVVSWMEDPSGDEVAVSWYRSENGAPMRARSSKLHGSGELVPAGIAVDRQERILVLGTFEGELQYAESATGKRTAGMHDIFLARLDRRGEVADCVTFGDGADQRAGDIAVGPEGEVVLSGRTEDPSAAGGGRDGVFVIALDAAELGRRFRRDFPGGVPPRLAAGADRRLFLAGALGADVFVQTLGPQGETRWSRRVGAGEDITVAGLATDQATGELFLAGSVSGTVDLGSTPRESSAIDLLIARLAP